MTSEYIRGMQDEQNRDGSPPAEGGGQKEVSGKSDRTGAGGAGFLVKGAR